MECQHNYSHCALTFYWRRSERENCKKVGAAAVLSKSQYDLLGSCARQKRFFNWLAEKTFARAIKISPSTLPANPQSDYLVTVVHLRLTGYPLWWLECLRFLNTWYSSFCCRFKIPLLASTPKNSLHSQRRSRCVLIVTKMPVASQFSMFVHH